MPTAPIPLRFLALGDSYTIGTSVDSFDSWPHQLVARLTSQRIPLNPPEIIAKNGWATRDLLAEIAEAEPQGPYDLVTLLIGVNNQYRGEKIAAYRPEFRALLGTAIRFAGGNPSRVIVISIPDWGLTPFAAGHDSTKIASQIDQFNAVNQVEAENAGTHYVDITLLTRSFGDDAEFLAVDGLHPSRKMYAAWVDLILPSALKILE